MLVASRAAKGKYTNVSLHYTTSVSCRNILTDIGGGAARLLRHGFGESGLRSFRMEDIGRYGSVHECT
jgi:hypothetical protein